MIRRTIFTVLWFPVAIGLLLANLALLSGTGSVSHAHAGRNTIKPYIAVAQVAPKVMTGEVVGQDARVQLIRNFLSLHDAPLANHAETLVRSADQYGLDYRMTTAIAMCESLGGKRVPKKSGHNPFGIAVYSDGTLGKRFDDWPHAIEWASKLLRTQYYDRGYTNLIDIGARWAPPSVEKGNSWANCVQSFMDKIL